MKEAVAGELAAAYHSAIVDGVRANDFRPPTGTPHDTSGARVRLLLRRRPRRRLRLPGPPAVPRPQRVPDRRDHPQPARQRSAARGGHPVPVRSGRAAATARPGGRRHPAGVRRHRRRHGAAVEPGLHARGHHLRLGAQRLEERRPLRAGRLHRRHPRQGEARGDARDRLTGAEVSATGATSSCSTGTKPRSSATTSATGGDRDGVPDALRRRRLARVRSRRATSPASAAPTRRRC